MNAKLKSTKSKPEIIKEGSVAVSIYTTPNRIYRRNPVTGRKELKSEHPQFTLAYYAGIKRVRRKFLDLDTARAEARLVVSKLANGETEVLKLSGTDRASYVHATQKLREWRTGTDLNVVVADYVAAARRLPDGVMLKECVDFWLQRHPANLPQKTVAEVAAELIKSKTDAGKSGLYIKDLHGRLNHFANAFQVPIASVTGAEIEEYLRALGRTGRTQNNYRRIIGTLFKFAIRRKYLPRDHDELAAVEKADDDSGDIEIFTPAELRQLFAVARPEMFVYLAIGAFAGLRAAELQRLDWSEVNLAGRYIEIKASKAKTASRRLAPIPDNLASWLAPHAQASGPVTPFANMSKQLTEKLAPRAGLAWKHNGLRHSFISYRLADINDMGQVALEAGNSAAMIFKHYRQLVTAPQAKEWFDIRPPEGYAQNIVPLPAAVTA
ncbi:MAG: tyrosine-type recombinase/integrase [Bryobacteraceae bacterium]